MCFDELPYQLLGETHVPLPAQKGKPQRYDYEYKREGSCNLLMFFQPLGGWRHIKLWRWDVGRAQLAPHPTAGEAWRGLPHLQTSQQQLYDVKLISLLGAPLAGTAVLSRSEDQSTEAHEALYPCDN